MWLLVQGWFSKAWVYIAGAAALVLGLLGFIAYERHEGAVGVREDDAKETSNAVADKAEDQRAVNNMPVDAERDSVLAQRDKLRSLLQPK